MIATKNKLTLQYSYNQNKIASLVLQKINNGENMAQQIASRLGSLICGIGGAALTNSIANSNSYEDLTGRLSFLCAGAFLGITAGKKVLGLQRVDLIRQYLASAALSAASYSLFYGDFGQRCAPLTNGLFFSIFPYAKQLVAAVAGISILYSISKTVSSHQTLKWVVNDKDIRVFVDAGKLYYELTDVSNYSKRTYPLIINNSTVENQLAHLENCEAVLDTKNSVEFATPFYTEILESVSEKAPNLGEAQSSKELIG